MNILYGNNQHLTMRLPTTPSNLGVLVSGGIDSAILYFLINLENKIIGNIHNVTPLMVMRNEGSKYFAKPVVDYIHSYFEMLPKDLTIVGDNTLPDHTQVRSGVLHAHALGFDIVYAGVIQQLPQHMINWTPVPSKETLRFKTPLSNLNKSHIIELCIKLKQTQLFLITHSCSRFETGRCNKCNGCNERAWGFEQLGETDLGTL